MSRYAGKAKDGTRILKQVQGGRRSVTDGQIRAAVRRVKLQALVSAITPENLHEEIKT